MNNPGPFFNPFMGFENNDKNYEKLINKVNRLEKDLRILENRVNKIERIDSKSIKFDDDSDMYMI